jgi:hypothetical protein
LPSWVSDGVDLWYHAAAQQQFVSRAKERSMETVISELPSLDAGALKIRFKARCTATNNVYQNWQIRVHRSLSWLKRGVEFGDGQPEARFLFLWIAFNSLYSRWNAGRNAPDADTQARDDFLDRVCAMDAGLVSAALHRHRGLIKRVLSDEYLSDVFWRDPDNPKVRGWATEEAHHIDQHFKAHEYSKVLREVTGRLFVLRGQIVHGASTGGSRLNRTSLHYCLLMLEAIVPLIQHIVIEHGCNDDWPDLCYPPQR